MQFIRLSERSFPVIRSVVLFVMACFCSAKEGLSGGCRGHCRSVCDWSLSGKGKESRQLWRIFTGLLRWWKRGVPVCLQGVYVWERKLRCLHIIICIYSNIKCSNSKQLCEITVVFLFWQIGTGFKDEDLEQHYNFLKVQQFFVLFVGVCLDMCDVC